MTKIELREIEVELRGEKQESGEMIVTGYVNRTGEWSQPLGREKRFVERIMPGTFTRALDKGNEVSFLAEHDSAKLLASTKNDSLKLREDDNGLFMEARISATSWGKDYHTLITDGLLTNMSFGMQVSEDKWEKRDDGTYDRSITDISLVEVSVVKNPAYSQSNIQARSADFISADELFFTEQNKNENLEEPKMSKEKQLKEIEARQAQLKAEIEQENRTATTVEVRKEVDAKETELRAMEQFIRKQEGEELRAVTAGSNPGALSIPTTMSDFIVEKITENAPLFARTKNFTPVNGFLEVLREQSIGNAGFVGEMTDLAKNDFTMDKIKLDQKRVGSAIEISQHLVNDSGIDVVNYAVNILGRRLGYAIDNSILIGNNTSQFEGIMMDPGNSIAKIDTASAGTISIDDLLEVYNSMNPTYQNGAVFVVSRTTFNVISKLKDAQGQFYLIHDVADNGARYKLFGCPVLINDAMPSFAAGMKAVLFANFAEGYATMTKKGLNLQHISGDTTQAMRGSHLLLLDGYMDGKILNQDALKVLRVKTA